MRVAIIGCGMGGPAAATFLARKGFRDITLFERAPEPGPVGAGILLQPTGQGVLQRLGLLEEARLLGRPVRRLEALSPAGKTILDLDYCFLQGHETGGLGIHRGALFQLLYRSAESEGVHVCKNCEITGLRQQSGKQVLLQDATGTQQGAFDLVIMSSGLRNTIRGTFLPPRRIRPYQWGARWTSLPDKEGVFSDVLFQVYEKTNRLVGFLPTGTLYGQQESTPLVSMFWSLKTGSKTGPPVMNEEALDWLKKEILRLAPRSAPLMRELTSPAQLVLATYADGRMPSWSAGSVAVLGDAAHPMSPHLGQGTNLALMDAEALADAVERWPDRLDRAFGHYEKQRRQHVEFYQWISRLMMPFFQSNHAILGVLRDCFVPRLCQIPWTRSRMLEVLAGLKNSPWSKIEL